MTQLSKKPSQRFIRKDNWDTLLQMVVTDYVTEQQLQYGKYDCALFFADCVLAMTSQDIIEDYRGYSTKKEGFKRLKATGFSTVKDLVDAALPRISIMQAVRGDLVMHTSGILQDKTTSPAVVLGSEAMSINEDGIISVGLHEMNMAWKVG